MNPRYIVLLIFFIFNGCIQPIGPLEKKKESIPETSFSWSTPLVNSDGWETGTWNWTYYSNEGCTGEARMELSPLPGEILGWKIRWKFSPALPASMLDKTLYLEPADAGYWHNQKWLVKENGAPVPIPRIAVDSTLYPDLLALLKELTTPYFNQIVTHWPGFPIPVRLVEANNGPLDLAECLTEAVMKWNISEPSPLFEINQSASWGIRLVHFPDVEMHPPLAVRITRLDQLGRPLRINLLVGNNYHNLQARPYVLRGFIHELGHALFLWGHSMDRIHILWGLAPPLISAPSLDERKAAHLWHGLPEGLDLSNYEINSPSVNMASSQRACHQAVLLPQERHHCAEFQSAGE